MYQILYLDTSFFESCPLSVARTSSASEWIPQVLLPEEAGPQTQPLLAQCTSSAAPMHETRVRLKAWESVCTLSKKMFRSKTAGGRYIHG